MYPILLVEDQADLREEIADVLQYEGFQCHAVADLTAARDYLDHHPVSLIVCSLMFPEDNGMNLLHHVRENHLWDAVPFLFLTGRVQIDVLREAMDAGADDYLLKPIRSRDLVRAIRARLKRAERMKSVGLKQFMQQREVLLHYFPHEVYTPLNVSLGVSRLIKKERYNMPPHELEKWATMITDNNTRLYHLMENQLMFLESNLTDLSTHMTRNVLELLPEVERLARERAEYYRREADLQLKLNPAEYPMRTKHFQIIVRALVDNAFKFSEPGDPVVVGLQQQQREVYFDVTDAGVGMSKTQIENIHAYQQFTRQYNEQQGIGLGLELCRRLLAVVHGKMTIESVENRYTHVQVCLK